MATHSSIWPGKSHGQRRLMGYSPKGRTQLSDYTLTAQLLTVLLLSLLSRGELGLHVPKEYSSK